MTEGAEKKGACVYECISGYGLFIPGTAGNSYDLYICAVKAGEERGG
jgi:hypothetical protein